MTSSANVPQHLSVLIPRQISQTVLGEGEEPRVHMFRYNDMRLELPQRRLILSRLQRLVASNADVLEMELKFCANCYCMLIALYHKERNALSDIIVLNALHELTSSYEEGYPVHSFE